MLKLKIIRFRLNEIVGEHMKKNMMQQNIEIEDYFEENLSNMMRNVQDYM